MVFIKDCAEVDESRSTSNIGPTPTSISQSDIDTDLEDCCRKKRKVNNKELEAVKLELYISCIEVLKPQDTGKTVSNLSLVSNEEQMFGQTIAETFSRFNDRQKPIAKKRISDVPFAVEMGMYNNSNIQMLPTNVFPQQLPDYSNFSLMRGQCQYEQSNNTQAYHSL